MRFPLLTHPQCVSDFSLLHTSLFSLEQLAYFKKYLTGLFCSVSKTISGINRLFVFDTRNQSSFNRFFTDSDWNPHELNRQRVAALQTKSHTGFKPIGVQIIDDTHNEKYGQNFEKIAKLYDHSRGYYHWAHDLVTSHYSDSKTDYPLGFRGYEQLDNKQAMTLLDQAGVKYNKERLQSKSESGQRARLSQLLKKHAVKSAFADKNELACQLLDEAVVMGFNGPVTFDTWFTNPTVCDHVEGQKRFYVGQLKGNRSILVDQDWQSLETWLPKLIADHRNPNHAKHQRVFQETSFKFKGVKKTYWTFSKVIHISKLGRKRVVISFKTAELTGTPKFFVCNNKLWNAAKILSIGRHRWPVEPFYEISKGCLGLDSYELRDFASVEKHWALVFYAYSIVKFQHPDCLMRDGDDNLKTFGDGLRTIQKEVWTALCTYCYECGQKNVPLRKMLNRLFP